MAIFKKYQGYIHEAKREAESRGFRLKNVKDMETVAHNFLLGCEPNENLFWHVHRELFHFGLCHKTYYLTAELAKCLIDSNYNLTLGDLKDIRFPYSSFDVALEPFSHNGYVLEGFLVTPPMNEASFNASKALTRRSANALGINIYEDSYATAPCTVNIAVCYGDFTSCIDFKRHGGVNLDTAIEETLASYDVKNKDEIRAYIKLAVGVMLYASLNDAEKRAFPAQTSKAFGEENGELLGETFTASPSWHLRKACFHVLSHPRFKRNEDGTPRRIWVRSCEVAKGKDMSFSEEKAEVLS